MKPGYVFYGLGWAIVGLGVVLAMDLFGAAHHASRLNERYQGQVGRQIYGSYFDKLNSPRLWRVWGVTAAVGFLVVVLVLWPRVIPL